MAVFDNISHTIDRSYTGTSMEKVMVFDKISNTTSSSLHGDPAVVGWNSKAYSNNPHSFLIVQCYCHDREYSLHLQGGDIPLHYTAYNYLRPRVKISSTVNLEYFP